jgi:hypothetical protein
VLSEGRCEGEMVGVEAWWSEEGREGGGNTRPLGELVVQWEELGDERDECRW